MDEEQRKALLMIASGAPVGDCLDALTDAVARLAPNTRACVLLASADRTMMAQGYSSHFPPAFSEAIRGLPIGVALIGACGAAIHEGRPFECVDIEHDAQWSSAWRALCLANGIRACYSHPALGTGGKAVGSFFLCLSEARRPDPWERRVAEFGALATSIVVERDRTEAHIRNEMYALNRLQELSAELVGPGEFELLLQKILAAAADISGTDKGNVQVYDSTSDKLRIVVHQGLSEQFIRHFKDDGWDVSCGEAAKQVKRLVVPDVEHLDDLEDTLGQAIVQREGIRSIQCTPLVSRDGRLLGMLNNHYDWLGGPTPAALRYIDLLARQAAELIERHQVEQELAQERRRKDEFLAMLAHELRNPLAPLCNMLEVQKRAETDVRQMRASRDVMARQLQQLVRLVDDLLDVNRINRGKLELRHEALTLDPILQQAIDVCEPLLTERGHTLHLSLTDSPVHLFGDPARLTQVFGNLLTNACKYTPAGGAIDVQVTQTADDVEVVVRDNGGGIPVDELDRIFEIFTQVDRSRDRAQGGLGIGLTLVKQLVDMHGGSVRANSPGLGQGSEFVVRLPLAAMANVAVARGPTHTPLTPRRILVVDDNADVAQSLATLLTLEGHEVHTAYGGAQALRLGAQLRPDLILMDIGMPDMSGHEACQRLRQEPWGQHTTVIALTGWGQDADRQQSAEAGFDAHLVKPVDLAALQAVLGERAPR
nr:ATP-binding protein [Verticiella sp. GG226]